MQSCLYDAKLVVKGRCQNVRRTKVVRSLVTIFVNLLGCSDIALGIFKVAESVDEAA